MAVVTTKVYIDPVSGNNANSGLTPLLAKATIAGAQSAYPTVVNYEFVLMTGTHTLTANVTYTNLQITFSDGAGVYSPVISGNYSLVFNTGSQIVRFNGNIEFQNWGGTNGVNGPVSASNGSVVFNECIFDGAGYSASTIVGSTVGMTYNDCEIKNLATIPATGTPSFICQNCYIHSPQSNTVALASNATRNYTFIGCTIKGYGRVIQLSSAVNGITPRFFYCTFDLVDGISAGVDGYFMWYSNASSITITTLNLKNSIIVNAEMIHNALAGTCSLGGPNIRNIVVDTATVTGLTDFDGDNIINTTDVKFYDLSTGDYRLKPDSPACKEVSGLDDTIGAYELAKPSDFYSGVSQSNVTLGVTYRELQLAVDGNNKTGTNESVDPGVANVHLGTGYKINSVTKVGTSDTTNPGVGNVKLGINYKLQSIPYVGTNESTDPGEANVLAPTTYKINSVLKTGSYVPPSITPTRVNERVLNKWAKALNRKVIKK